MLRVEGDVRWSYEAIIVALSAERDGGKVFLSEDFSKYTFSVFALWPFCILSETFSQIFVACL